MAAALSDKIATESNINRLALICVLLWLLAWTPYAVVVLIFNCFTFVFSHPHIQNAAKKSFPCLLKLDNKNKTKLTDAKTYEMKI